MSLSYSTMASSKSGGSVATSNGGGDSSTNGGGGGEQPTFSLPPAYDIHRTDRIDVPRGSTEDSIQSSMDYSSSITGATEDQYEGFRQVGGDEKYVDHPPPPSAAGADGDENHPTQRLNLHPQGQFDQQDIVDPYYTSSAVGTAEDATSTIHKMHAKLLYLLSHPELFHEALSWEDKQRLAEYEQQQLQEKDKFEEDSTFEGLSDTKNEVTQNETFEFNPNNGDVAGEGGDSNKKEEEHDASSPPLPFEIFASDAEVVLPQALTATQLFGVERDTGIELEAAAGIPGLSHLFLRWLALMPEGDHMNVINPPGLTVMRIAGGGYRVTAAHRVVWRWMNKFSFSNHGVSGDGGDTSASAAAGGEASKKDDTDFDFGDLVTMTIIDVFETDMDGRLLSYCPTFDNRAVHKTREATERLRKGASQIKERMEVIANSPAGKRVNMVSAKWSQHYCYYDTVPRLFWNTSQTNMVYYLTGGRTCG